MIKIFKKLSFLWIVIGTLAIHFIVKKVGSQYYELPILVILWTFLFVYILGFLNSLLSSERKWNYMLKNSFGPWTRNTIIAKDKNIEENQRYLLQNGDRSIGVINDIMVKKVHNSSFCGCVLINYCFLNFKKSYIQNFIKTDLENIPKIGDKIEIIYEKNNPENSMIVCEKPSKAPWYKLQKKYKIKIINNQ